MKTLETGLKVPFADLRMQYEALKTEIDAAIGAVIDRSAFVGGHFVNEFEEQFASYCGVTHCVGVANGTDALFVALRALGVGPGDEVLTAANSFIATSEAITMAGARPVFVDINPHTYTIDPERIREKLTSRTKALIPVHLYGQPADMEAVCAVARAHGLFVVGDAAQAHGALYRRRPVSQCADITCFSFYPGKNLGAYGDAGALVTDCDEWANRARMFANHGRTSRYSHECEGVNSRLDGLQAAVLSVKLRHLEAWTERRRAIAYRYNDALQDLALVTPVELDAVRAVYHLYVVRVPGGMRGHVRQLLTGSGIETGIHYPIALPYLEAYRDRRHSEDDYPEAVRAANEILSLPMFPEMTDRQIDRVVGSLRSVESLREMAVSRRARSWCGHDEASC